MALPLLLGLGIVAALFSKSRNPSPPSTGLMLGTGASELEPIPEYQAFREGKPWSPERAALMSAKSREFYEKSIQWAKRAIELSDQAKLLAYTDKAAANKLASESAAAAMHSDNAAGWTDHYALEANPLCVSADFACDDAFKAAKEAHEAVSPEVPVPKATTKPRATAPASAIDAINWAKGMFSK